MIKKLLVAIDASQAAVSATEAAEQLAVQVGAAIVLVHIVDAGVVTSDGTQRFAPTIDELKRSGEALLINARARITAKLDVSSLLLEGDPADTIVSTARLCDADMIVIGTDSRGRLAHFLLGSTTDGVIRRAHCPVLAVRQDAKPPWQKARDNTSAVA
jgi:nucleotide-binding universal stress UspA family protein